MRPVRPIAIATALIAAATAIPASAQDAPDLIGDWEISWETPRGQATMTVTFSATDDGGFTGVAQTRMGEAPVKDIALDGEKVTFSIEFGRDDRTFLLPFEGTLSGDTLSGTISGRMGEPAPFKGQRKEADPTGA